MYGYYHISIQNNYLDIIDRHFSILKKSGLWHATHKIFVSIQNEIIDYMGIPKDLIEIFNEHDSDNKKIFIRLYNHNIHSLVSFSRIMRDDSLFFKQKGLNFNIWFIHNLETISLERSLIEEVIIWNWEKCNYLINFEYVLLGMNYDPKRNIYIDNYWWSNTNYISSLSTLSYYQSYDRWIFSGQGKFYDILSTHINKTLESLFPDLSQYNLLNLSNTKHLSNTYIIQNGKEIKSLEIIIDDEYIKNILSNLFRLKEDGKHLEGYELSKPLVDFLLEETQEKAKNLSHLMPHLPEALLYSFLSYYYYKREESVKVAQLFADLTRLNQLFLDKYLSMKPQFDNNLKYAGPVFEEALRKYPDNVNQNNINIIYAKSIEKKGPNVTESFLKHFPIINNEIQIPKDINFNQIFGDPFFGCAKEIIIITNNNSYTIPENRYNDIVITLD